MIKLPSLVEFSDVIQPVDLSCTSKNSVDVVAMGNGNLLSEDETPPILRYSNMKTISLIECALKLPVVAFRNGVICTKAKENQSICIGDSGGPLVETKTNNLIGVGSFGSAWYGCAQNVLGFARVSFYLSWIEQVAGVACRQ